MEWIALLVASFALGSLPFGYILARSRGIDIRAIGSGNIGATNVARALGKKLGLIVFALDVLKGLVPALAAFYIVPPAGFPGSTQEFAFLAGAMAILGHCLSPFMGFRGGKGVATGLGAILGVAPFVALISFGLFAVLLVATRYVSFSSIIAVSAMPLSGWLLGHSTIMIAAYVLLATFIILRHKGNIRKLLGGTERRFSFSGSSGKPSESPNMLAESPRDPKGSAFVARKSEVD